MSSRCSCVLTTQDWNLPFPRPEPGKEGGKVPVSPNHEAKRPAFCCLEQFLPLNCPSLWSGSPCLPQRAGAVEEGRAQCSPLSCPTHSGALPLLRLGRRGPQESIPGSHRSPCPSAWVSSHTVPAQATLIHQCDDPRVTSCCPAPAPPQSDIGFWIPLVTLDFTPGSTHRDPKDASGPHGAKPSPG